MIPKPLQRPSVRLYFGRSGTGKTRLAFSDIGPQRAILFDINEQSSLEAGAEVVDTANGLLAALSRPYRRICWRGFRSMGPEAFDFANQAAWAAGGCVAFWDELDLLAPAYPFPGWAYRLINAGRHRGVTIAATARRPSAMPRHVTAAATMVASFQITGQRDIAYCAEFFGKGEALNLPVLMRGEALVWTEAGVSRKKIW